MKYVLLVVIIGALIWGLQSTECPSCSYGSVETSNTVTCSTCKGGGDVTCSNSRKWFEEVESGVLAIGTTRNSEGKRGYNQSYYCNGGYLKSTADQFNGRRCDKCQGTKKHDCNSCNGYGHRTSTNRETHSACNGTGEVLNFDALFN